jgi:hypothetical protein
MILEHGKRYVLNSGLITPPMISRHGGISFEVGVDSLLLWEPDGTFIDLKEKMNKVQITDLSVAAEFQEGAT